MSGWEKLDGRVWSFLGSVVFCGGLDVCWIFFVFVWEWLFWSGGGVGCGVGRNFYFVVVESCFFVDVVWSGLEYRIGKNVGIGVVFGYFCCYGNYWGWYVVSGDLCWWLVFWRMFGGLVYYILFVFVDYWSGFCGVVWLGSVIWIVGFVYVVCLVFGSFDVWLSGGVSDVFFVWKCYVGGFFWDRWFVDFYVGGGFWDVGLGVCYVVLRRFVGGGFDWVVLFVWRFVIWRYWGSCGIRKGLMW